MRTVRVRPGVVSGVLDAPPSKSYTHRALVAGYLAQRRYAVEGPLDADDTRSTAGALRPLGSRVTFSAGRWAIAPDPSPGNSQGTIDCGESGTTLRFAAALAARSGRTIRLRGRGRLPYRPIAELFDALESLGADCHRAPGPRALPTTVRGPIHGGNVRLDASISSQFVSALLLTLPTVPEASTVDLVGPIVSEPYIRATLAVLRHHRVRVGQRGRRFTIPGGQTYRGSRMRVPGDASSAAYFWTAAAITGGRLQVRGIPRDWPQADLAILELLESSGATVRRTANGALVTGGNSTGFTVDLTPAPDLYPLAGVLAATIPARSRIEGALHVVHKESDRRSGTIHLARAMGAKVRPDRSGLTIVGTAHPRPLRLRGLDDHRLVMSAAVGALVASRPSSIHDGNAVAKSYPGFWNALSALRSEPMR
jgi:3-phosphoshikimate 1-carboxyvinyltransferase